MFENTMRLEKLQTRKTFDEEAFTNYYSKAFSQAKHVNADNVIVYIKAGSPYKNGRPVPKANLHLIVQFI